MRHEGEKGAALVEFAIVVPLLMVILFGIIEFSIVLYDKAMLTNASREGARAGVVFQRQSLDDINQVVRDYAENYLINFHDASALSVVTIPADPSTVAAGQPLSVTVNYTYDYLLLPALVTSLAGEIDLSATSVMRAE